MKSLTLAAVVIGAGLALSAAGANAMAPAASGFSRLADASIIHVAHAGAPYKNVDKRNDAGNDTGDSQVDRLNDESLAKARQK